MLISNVALNKNTILLDKKTADYIMQRGISPLSIFDGKYVFIKTQELANLTETLPWIYKRKIRKGGGAVGKNN